MSTQKPAILINAEQLAGMQAQNPQIVLVAVQSVRDYMIAHIPGSTHIVYTNLVASQEPAGGLLPSAEHFSATLAAAGLNGDDHIIAYDSEGGAAASRLIWNLHAYGHTRASLLNGGLQNWQAQGRSLETVVNTKPRGNFTVNTPTEALIDAEELMARLSDAQLRVIDARSRPEYDGVKVVAKSGGHIPGAKHLEWLDALDRDNSLCLKDDASLRGMLERQDIHPDHEVVVYCQTHRRSSLSFVMLKHLGYPRVRGYAGSWSEWGNRKDTPIENRT